MYQDLKTHIINKKHYDTMKHNVTKTVVEEVKLTKRNEEQKLFPTVKWCDKIVKTAGDQSTWVRSSKLKGTVKRREDKDSNDEVKLWKTTTPVAEETPAPESEDPTSNSHAECEQSDKEQSLWRIHE